jgi:Glycosyltransferase family 87
LVAAMGVAVAATRRIPVAAASPLASTGTWRQALIASLVVAFVAQAIAVGVALRSGGPRLGIAGVACVIQLLPLLSPLLLSTDVYTYWDYGRLAAKHGVSPYETAPSAFPSDPAYSLMGATWHHTTTLYGPLFTWLSSRIAVVVGSAHAAELSFRIVAVASMIGIVVTLYKANGSAAALVLAGWSPLFALHFAGGGHNDALMMLCAVAAAALGARRGWGAAMLWLAAVAVKWVAVVFIVLDLLATPRRQRRRFAGQIAVACIAAAGLAVLEYRLTWLSFVRTLSAQSRRTGSLGLGKWLGDLGLGHRPIVVLLGLSSVVFLAVLAWIAYRHRRRHLSLAGTGVALLQGWLNPWYALWGGAMLEFDTAAVAAAFGNLVLAAIVLRDALPL